MRRPDHHNEVELNFLESGSVTYLLGGTKTVVEAGKLSVFWAAIPHQIIDYGNETAYYVATIPLQCFLQWRLPENFVQPLMQGRLVSEPSAERASSDTQLFEHWESDLLKKASELERPVLLEMQARLIRLALNIPAPSKPRKKRDRLATITDTGLNKVEQMACFIAQNCTGETHRGTDRRVREIAPELRDESVSKNIRHDVDQLPHAAPGLPCATSVRDDRADGDGDRVRVRLSLQSAGLTMRFAAPAGVRRAVSEVARARGRSGRTRAVSGGKSFGGAGEDGAAVLVSGQFSQIGGSDVR